MLNARRKPTLSEKAYNRIKDALCDGTFPPGELLSENMLARQLGMSRTPVREALRALENEGWITIQNGVGAYVRPLSSRDAENLYEVRCLLETQAIKTSIFNITEEEIDAFEARFRALLAEIDSGQTIDPRRFSALDWELHELIVERCQNNYIKAIMRNNISNLKRYQFLSVKALGNPRESTLQHLNILALMRLRDPNFLSRTLETHLLWSSSFLSSP